MQLRRRCHQGHQWCHHTVRVTECEHVYANGLMHLPSSITVEYLVADDVVSFTSERINSVVTASSCIHLQDTVSHLVFVLLVNIQLYNSSLFLNCQQGRLLSVKFSRAECRFLEVACIRYVWHWWHLIYFTSFVQGCIYPGKSTCYSAHL